MAHAASDDLVQAVLSQRVKPRIYIESAGRLAVPLQCRHCEDAPCLRVCSSGALWRADEAGPVLVRQERCIGCAFCVEVCPFGVIRLARVVRADASDKELAVLKCDLCQQPQAAGLPPACVASCPVKGVIVAGGGGRRQADASGHRRRAWRRCRGAMMGNLRQHPLPISSIATAAIRAC